MKMMNSIEQILSRMRGNGDNVALFWKGEEQTYLSLFNMIDAWRERLDQSGIGPGAVCGVLGDFSPQTCALLFALMQARAIIVPFTHAIESELPALMKISGVQHLIRFDADDRWSQESLGVVSQNELVTQFLARGVAGLVVFTSGSTGEPKGILQDCERVMHKFVTERRGWRTVLFLMMDHFGGFNTFLSAFAYGGAAVCVNDRTPGAVCQAIEQSRATLLPTTPTFLNLLIASRSYKDFDVSTIELITYGTEVMPNATLEQVGRIFPNATIKQTYGLSELGVLRSKSRSNDSPWVKLGGEGFEVKVVKGILWVRSEANMVGYLNVPSPIDEDGWMCTGDQVEVDGDYIRFMGRESEIINVGGQKVFPVEVETVLLQADNIRDATVFGAKHPLLGQVVHARVTLDQPEDRGALTERLRVFCLGRLAKFKMPVRFAITKDTQHSARYKKIRTPH